MRKKIIFLDRDGTLIEEPADQQIDSIEKFKLKPNVIPALLKLQAAGYTFVLVSNQDGLGTPSFPEADFVLVQNLLLTILASQNIHFAAIYICPHFASDRCACRKPNINLVLEYLQREDWDRAHSYVIGDRQTDLEFAKNMGIRGILYEDTPGWLALADELTLNSRAAKIQRITQETAIQGMLDLAKTTPLKIHTGIGFFDHMLEQLAKHAGFSLVLQVEGDLVIDEHHTVEDTALALGQALRQALGDKLGIQRYGFLLPMDEALTEIALDLSGRSFFVFDGHFPREKVGELPTELVAHFFRSLAESLLATLHIKVQGENAHHMIESIFKGVGRALRQAIQQQGHELPSTKGIL